MAQDAKIMAAAHRRFQADREARQAELERRIEEIHRRLPRGEAIDRELGSTAARLVLAAFEAEGDPGPVIQELEKTNLALQRERAELLVGAGYPYDYIDGPLSGQRLSAQRRALPVPDSLLRQGAEPAAEQAAGSGRPVL